MVAWSHLPVEIRHEIVTKMDFRTRFRFRHVSKTDQRIVDSVPLNPLRIALKFEGEDRAELDVYFGIRRKISVDFEKNKEGEAKVKVYGESIKKPVQKLVECENAALLAFTAFQNIAIHPNTLINGLDVFVERMTIGTGTKIRRQMKGQVIRTKILATKDTKPALLLFLPNCSDPDLREIHYVNKEFLNTPSVFTWTRNVQITVENPIELPYTIGNFYSPCHTGKSRPAKVDKNKRSTIKKHGPHDISFTGSQEDNYQYTRVSPCGVVGQMILQTVENKNRGVCEMRWTCAKHTDPFEYWYYQQLVEPSHLMLQSSVIAAGHGKFYYEKMHPICNGEDAVDRLINLMKLQAYNMVISNRWASSKIIEEPILNSIKYEFDKLGLNEFADEKQASAAAGAAEKGSEMKEPQPGNGSEAAPEKEITTGEVEKASDEQPLDAAGGAQETSEVTLDDSEADEDLSNPFNTDEFKSKFNKSSGGVDKFWASLMIFSVLSVVFAFFFTFF